MSEGEQRLSCPECVSRKGKQTEKNGQSVSHSNIHEAVSHQTSQVSPTCSRSSPQLVNSHKGICETPIAKNSLNANIERSVRCLSPVQLKHVTTFVVENTAVYTRLSENHFSPGEMKATGFWDAAGTEYSKLSPHMHLG